MSISIKRTCCTCGETKYLRDFYKRKYYKDGYRSDCKKCFKEKSDNRWHGDAESVARCAARSRELSIKNNYNITVGEYDEILSKPCAICGDKSTVLDYDHIAGKILEGLCHTCNILLGSAREDKMLLEKAIQYIIKHDKHSKRNVK